MVALHLVVSTLAQVVVQRRHLEGELLEQGDHRAVDVEQARYSCYRTELSGDKMKDNNN
jgi:hypothetical protein